MSFVSNPENNSKTYFPKDTLRVALFISNVHDSNLKGPQKVGMTLVEELSRKAVRTLIITNSVDCKIPELKRISPFVELFIIPGEAGFSGYLRYFHSLFKKLVEFRPQIIHGNGVLSASLVSFLGKILRVPTIQTVNDVCLTTRFLKNIQINGLLFVDKILCSSNFIKEYLINRNISAEKIVVLPYGIEPIWFNLSQFPSNVENEAILFWGDANEGRGIDTLLKAIPKVLKFFPKAKFMFAIRDYDPEYYKTMQDFEKLYPIIIDSSKRHISEVVLSAGIIVLPYNITTMQPPLTLIESLIAKKAVVTTDVEANKEFIGNDLNGILVEKNNPDQLADAVMALLSNSEKREAIAINAHEFTSRQYNWDKAMEIILSLYNEAVSKGR